MKLDELRERMVLTLSRADGAIESDDDDLLIAANAAVETTLHAVAAFTLNGDVLSALDKQLVVELSTRRDILRRRVNDAFRLS